MPTDTNALRPLQRPNNLTVRGRAITIPKMGPVTQSFFARGEEQEASGYENLAADDPILAPPELEFDSFDKIPRKRGSWFALAVSLLVVAAVGVVTWRSFHFLSKPGSSVTTASRAMVQSPPLSQSAPAPVPAVPPAPAMTVTPPAEPTAPASRSESAEPAAAPETHAIAPPVIVALPPRHTPARARHEPLRGYVWSPEKHTIVPVEPVIQDPVPAESPHAQTLDGTPAEEPQQTPEPTSPAPFEATPAPAPVPNTSAPIVE